MRTTKKGRRVAFVRCGPRSLEMAAGEGDSGSAGSLEMQDHTRTAAAHEKGDDAGRDCVSRSRAHIAAEPTLAGNLVNAYHRGYPLDEGKGSCVSKAAHRVAYGKYRPSDPNGVKTDSLRAHPSVRNL